MRDIDPDIDPRWSLGCEIPCGSCGCKIIPIIPIPHLVKGQDLSRFPRKCGMDQELVQIATGCTNMYISLSNYLYIFYTYYQCNYTEPQWVFCSGTWLFKLGLKVFDSVYPTKKKTSLWGKTLDAYPSRNSPDGWKICSRSDKCGFVWSRGVKYLVIQRQSNPVLSSFIQC